MPIFEKDGRRREGTTPVQIVKLRHAGWREVQPETPDPEQEESTPDASENS